MSKKINVSGILFLVTLFSILCMAIFSMLSITTALNEQQVAEMVANNTVNYYKADSKAIEILRQVYSKHIEVYEDIEIAYGIDSDTNNETVSYAVSIDDNKSLEVSAILTEDEPVILYWKTVYNGDWDTVDIIEVWDGF